MSLDNIIIWADCKIEANAEKWTAGNYYLTVSNRLHNCNFLMPRCICGDYLVFAIPKWIFGPGDSKATAVARGRMRLDGTR